MSIARLRGLISQPQCHPERRPHPSTQTPPNPVDPGTTSSPIPLPSFAASPSQHVPLVTPAQMPSQIPTPTDLPLEITTLSTDMGRRFRFGCPRRSPHLSESRAKFGLQMSEVSTVLSIYHLATTFWGSRYSSLFGSAAWISWLNLSVLIATLAMALFNASEDNEVARTFAYAYATISVGVLVSGSFIYISFLPSLSAFPPKERRFSLSESSLSP
jgi:hypothetical protein